MPQNKFHAQFNSVCRETIEEASKDYEEILACLNKHRPDLVPLALRHVESPFVYVKDRG